MQDTTPRQPKFLKDYAPPDYLIEEVDLGFALEPKATRVASKLRIRPNPKVATGGRPLQLDGEAFKLESVAIDGNTLSAGDYALTDRSLTIAQVPAHPFTLEIVTTCDPEANTELSGLYRSRGTYCTQCEPEGFRRITFFIDRPDVLAVYTVRIEADKASTPMLLSNGNPVEQGDIEGTGRHYAVWHDPFPKPSYLFALVGGDLTAVRDSFVTTSGREVALAIYVEPGKEDRCAWAMDSLEALHALGRGTLRPRIRSRRVQHRRRSATSTWARWRTRASISSTTSSCWRDPTRRATATTPRSRA